MQIKKLLLLVVVGLLLINPAWGLPNPTISFKQQQAQLLGQLKMAVLRKQQDKIKSLKGQLKALRGQYKEDVAKYEAWLKTDPAVIEKRKELKAENSAWYKTVNPLINQLRQAIKNGDKLTAQNIKDQIAAMRKAHLQRQAAIH